MIPGSPRRVVEQPRTGSSRGRVDEVGPINIGWPFVLDRKGATGDERGPWRGDRYRSGSDAKGASQLESRSIFGRAPGSRCSDANDGGHSMEPWPLPARPLDAALWADCPSSGHEDVATTCPPPAPKGPSTRPRGNTHRCAAGVYPLRHRQGLPSRPPALVGDQWCRAEDRDCRRFR